MLLTESRLTEVLTKGLQYHLETKTPLYENVFRPGSEEYFNTIRQARTLMNKGVLTELCLEDMELLFETEVGEYGEYNGKRVPLDFPMLNEAVVVTEPQTTEFTQAWNVVKQSPELQVLITKEAEKRQQEPYTLWLDLASKGKAAGGVAYKIEVSAISKYISEQEEVAPEEAPTADVQEVMPIVVKYMANDSVTYSVLTGQETYQQIQGTDTDVWVVDLTTLQEQETPLQELLDKINEGKLDTVQKRELVRRLIKAANGPAAAKNVEQILADIERKLSGTAKSGIVKYAYGKRVDEAKYHGKEVKLNKPMRSSGPKKYKVYTKNAKGNVIVVNFGDAKGGLTAKINNAKARKAFSDRHNCPAKKDKTKAGYWSCRLPRYASLLGLKSSFSGYW